MSDAGKAGWADISVERSMELEADIESVWENVVEGPLVSEWIGSPMSIEPRVGGAVDFAPDGEPFIGTVEEVVPGRSITWSWRHPDRDPSQVTITLEPAGTGTTITVVERLLPYRITDIRSWPGVIEMRQRAMTVRLAA
jgi:uncharacterized protein YndB with AHSA1/START domain